MESQRKIGRKREREIHRNIQREKKGRGRELEGRRDRGRKKERERKEGRERERYIEGDRQERESRK